MSDMGDLFREWNEFKREQRDRNLQSAFANGTDGWTIHTPFHWSRRLLGDPLDYWPSKKKFRWRGKNRYGENWEIENFIRRREAEAAGQRAHRMLYCD